MEKEFQVNEVIFHKFYGIGQIVLSKKENVDFAVVFFSNPNQIFPIDGITMKMESLEKGVVSNE